VNPTGNAAPPLHCFLDAKRTWVLWTADQVIEDLQNRVFTDAGLGRDIALDIHFGLLVRKIKVVSSLLITHSRTLRSCTHATNKLVTLCSLAPLGRG